MPNLPLSRFGASSRSSTLLSLWAAVCILSCGMYQARAQQALRPAAQPPPLQVSQWLQAPAAFNAQWASLRGRVVVVEFWATWCSPCIAAIPHMNQLATEFRDRDVTFLAITDDDEDRLKSFFLKTPLQAIVGVDEERRNWETFSVPSIPHTVLIGRDGRVIATTSPENVTSAVLREALAGKSVTLPAEDGVPSDLEWDDHLQWEDGVRPVAYSIIKPITTLTSGAWPRPGHLTADGVPLATLVQLAYQTNSYHVDWQAPTSEVRYRAAFRVPEERQQQLFPYMQETLALMFGIRAKWIDEERDVFVLRRIPGEKAPFESRSDKAVSQMLRGRITLQRQPMTELCEMLANEVSAIVVNETSLERLYDFEIPYQPGQPEVTVDALRKNGLELLKARRPVKMLVVSSDEPSVPRQPPVK